MVRFSLRGACRLTFALAVLTAAAPGVARAEDPIRWRGDYSAARKEAEEKGLPLLVEIGTEACVFCRKQDATTFRDPIITQLLNKRFVPLKIDATRYPDFVEAMRVKMYPTTVVAAPDGTILVFHAGYLSPDELRAHLKRTQPPVAD